MRRPLVVSLFLWAASLTTRSSSVLAASIDVLASTSSNAATLPLGATTNHTTAKKKFKLLLLNGGSDFFEPVAQGFVKKCADLNLEAQYYGPYWDTMNASSNTDIEVDIMEYTDSCEAKYEALRWAIVVHQVDGIAAKPPCNESIALELAELAYAAQIPLVFFDRDYPNSKRSAYIGTNQEFLGRTMARLLKQLQPSGGTFAFVAHKPGRSDGFLEEITKDNKHQDKPHWHEIGQDLSGIADNMTFVDAADKWWFHLTEKAMLKPTAMIFMSQSPMRHENWTIFVDEYVRANNITLIGVDGADYQLDYLNRRYVDGLVGQMPYEMGWQAVTVLHDLLVSQQQQQQSSAPSASSSILPTESSIITTNVVAYNLIPVELPHLEIDQNLLGDLRYVGFGCFVMVALSATLCIAWTMYYRHNPFLRMAQPFFLLMIAMGVIIMASALIPLSYDYDDQGRLSSSSQHEQQEQQSLQEQDSASDENVDTDNSDNDTSNDMIHGIAICMSIPWLSCLGFTVVFSALFGKTWRINRLFNYNNTTRRVTVSVTDVLMPFFVIMTCNVIVLVCWTVMDPLTYVRQYKSGTDFWNREIESYGACRSENAVAYLVPLLLFNLIVVASTCWQAFEARDISSQFSESKSIGMSLASILQTFLTGIPVVAVVRDMPVAFYLVMTFVIFALAMVILLFTFVPKINHQRQFLCMSESEQLRVITGSIRKHVRQSSRELRIAGDLSGSFQLSNDQAGGGGGGGGGSSGELHPPDDASSNAALGWNSNYHKSKASSRDFRLKDIELIEDIPPLSPSTSTCIGVETETAVVVKATQVADDSMSPTYRV